ncbi:exodeoxyribonuclease V subunit beta [Methylomicrobium agile]|uniref:exodeoxyribonuclease V subunit beta n=1 Tax=Methylomicrobium agile TaxID=39774 RepID=UPI0004DF82CD|nr:exodeoxyribonuclease V subunit beta [Methylomicrobium agile]
MTAAIPLNPFDFPLSGVRLIEASAGTGKTYTIAALYVRLILGHSPDNSTPARPLLPPDILVVTFTEAATQELRERIRDRLSQAARYFRKQAVEADEFLKAVRADFPETAWPARARDLELAANWMDEAAIYTIHGWCNKMLQQHAFHSGSLFRQEVHTGDTELLHEVVKDYWRTFFYPLTDTASRAVTRFIKSPVDLAGLLTPLLPETEALGLDFNEGIDSVFQSWEAWETQRQALEISARTCWSNGRDSIEKLLNDASENGWLNGNKYRKTSFGDKLKAMAEWANGRSYLAIDDLERFGRSRLSSALVKSHIDKAELMRHPALEAMDDLTSHCGKEIDLDRKICLHALQWIRNRYASEKQRMTRMTFDDMLTRLDSALHGHSGERLKETIRRQYPVALIDEFQDTDPIQYRIFSSIYPANIEDGSGCFMIGDPKQAIYSFRGADIYTYLKAHQHTAGRRHTLTTNYRSTAAMVEAVNRVFLHADGRHPAGVFRFKRERENPLPFLEVGAKGRKEEWQIDHRAAPALTFWLWNEGKAVGMPEYREKMAEAAAGEIVKLLNLANAGQAGFKSAESPEPLKPSDIAILVRSGTEARAMRKALAKRNLRSVYLSEKDSIFRTREASDLLIWLKALADPRNERKVRAALGTAAFGWTYRKLHRLVQDEPEWELHLDRFLTYHARWRQDGILPALRQLIDDYALYTRARLETESEGERSLTNLLHLAELMQQAGSQLEGEQALIRYLAESVANGSGRLGDEEIIRLESDADLIKIVTIHKSKGLEYPLVFLPFICSYKEVTGRNSHYRYHDEQNDDRRLIIDLGKSEENKRKHDAERLQEDLRLLYVAMTRACHACWLGIAPVKSGTGEKCQLEKSAVGSLLNWETDTPTEQLGTRLAELKGNCAAIEITALPAVSDARYTPQAEAGQFNPARTVNARIPADWWIASYSALSAEDKLQTEPAFSTDLAHEPETARDDKRSDEAEPDAGPVGAMGIHGLPRGAAPGVLIHDLLERCARFGFAEIHAKPELANAWIQERFAAKDWAGKHGVVVSALSDWLTLPLLENTDLCLGRLTQDAYQPELEFLIGADKVDTQALDRLITRHTFSSLPRPALLPAQVNGLLKGFIDLVFVHEERYYVADYKFNSLGSGDAVYTQEALNAAMLAKRYDLQSALYLLALHRQLKARLGTHYDYDTHIGGSLYLFLRGCQSPTGGRVFAKPPKALIEGLDRLFANGGAA